MPQLDTIYNKAQDAWRRPQIRRRIKWAAVITLALNLIAWPLASYFISSPGDTKALSALEGDGLLIYAEASNTTPQWRTYSNSANDFSANSGTVTGAQPVITQVRTSPTKQEAIAGYQDTSGNLRIMCYDGTSWSEDWSVAVAASGTPTTRRFDMIYETSTGDVTVAYSRNTAATNALAYRTKSGSSGCGSANWSSATNFPTTSTITSGTVYWVRATRDGRSVQDLSAWAWLDSASDLGASIWSGSAFGNLKLLDASVEYDSAVADTDNFDLQYESLSGDVMIVWGNSAGGSGTNGYRYNTCTGGTASCTWLGTAGTISGPADGAANIDLSADPLSDKMAMAGICNASSDLSAGYWSGTGWTGYANVDTSTEATISYAKLLTTGWLTNNGNTKWYVSYDDSTGTGLSYKYAIPGSALTSPADYVSTPVINDIRGRYDTDVNPHNHSELIQTVADSTNNIFAFRLSMDTSGNLAWSNMTSAASLGTKPSHPQQGFAFQYWRYVPLIITTVSATGTQTSTVYIGSADNYLGGAFTLVNSLTSINVTQIVVTDTGTVNASTNLSNLDLYYETSGTCTYDGTETLFGTAASFSSESATVTGTMAVGTSQVCVYALVDVGSGASVGDTIEIQITNPSTQVTVSSGTVTPATAVVISGTTTIASASADISGTVWTNEAKSTNIGANKTVHLYVNATSKGTDETDTSGAYLFSGITGITANDSVIVYLDDETENGSTVTIAVNGSTNITALDIITDHISLEHRTAGPITNTDLDDIDGVDATDEDGITVATPNATFADGYELYVLSGETYTPGGTVTCDNFEAVGTATLWLPDSGTINVSGDWTFSSSGTFHNQGGTVNFNGTSSQTITTGGTGIGFGYVSVNINNTGANSVDDNMYVNGNWNLGYLTITDGNLRLDTNNPSLEIWVRLEIGANGAVTKGAGNVIVPDGMAIEWLDYTAAKQDIGNVITFGSAWVSVSSSVKCTSFTMTSTGTLVFMGSYTLTLTGNGTPLNLNSGTFTPSTGTIEYAPSGTTGVTVESTTYHHVIFNKAGNTFSLETGGITTDAGGNMTLQAGTLNANSQNQNLGGNLTLESGITFTKGGTMTFQGTSQTITDNNATKQDLGTVTIGPATTTSVSTATGIAVTNITIGDNDTLDISSDTMTITGSGSPFVHNTGGTFTVTGSTVAYTGSSATTVTNTTYNNLDIGGSGTTATYTVGSGGITVGGVLTVVSSSGTNTLSSSGGWITLTGTGTPFVISATEIFDPAGSAVAYYGSPSANVTGATYYDLIIGSTTTTATFTAAGDLSADQITIVQSSGTNTFDAADKTITLTGTGDPLFVGSSEVFDCSTSTVIFTGTGGATNVPGEQFNNLSFNPASAATYTLSWHLTDSYTMLGSLSIGANATLDTGAATNYNISLAGNWTNSGTFTANSSTVTLSGSTGTKTIASGGSAFNNLVLNDGGGSATFQPTENMTVNGDFTLTDGILDLNTSDPTFILGDDTGTGNVNFNGGSIVNSDSANIIFNDNPTELYAPGFTFGNVQIGMSPATTNLKSDFSASNLTISSGDVLNTKGYEITLTDYLTNSGTLNATDATEGDGTIITLGGNWTNSSTFTAANSEVIFNKSSGTQTLNSGGTGTGKLFNKLTHSGAGTLQLVTNALDVDGDFSQTSGTFDCNSLNQDFAGNFSLSNSTTFTKGGTTTFNPTGTKTVTDNNSTKQDLGVVSISSGSTTPKIQMATSIKVSTLTIAASHEFDLTSNGYTLELGGTGSTATVLTNSGTFTTGTSSTTKYTATNSGGNVNLTTVIYNNLEIAPSTSETYLQLASLTGSNAITGDVTIGTNATLDNDSTNKYSLELKGSWANSGSYTHNSGGTVTFSATTTGKTIVTGGASTGDTFYNIVFNSSTGGWTIQTNNLTADNNFTIIDTATSGFTVSSVVVEVKGTYSIANAETSNTTWTSATLYLNSGTSYTIGTSSQNAETYSTIQVGANTDIRTWYSSASTYTVDSSGSLYSQDHANTNGHVYIWGDYHTLTNDYWDYDKDFDGTSLGTPRAVRAYIDPSSKVTIDSGDTLEVVGTGFYFGSITRQGSSNGYQFENNGGTLNIQNCSINYLDGPYGIDIKSGSTITSLDHTTFDYLVGTAGTSDAFITVASSVIGSATKTITDVYFGNTGTGAEFNVNRTGSDDTGYWDFDASWGSFDGESYDGDDGVNEANPGMLRWDDSTINTAPNNPSSLDQIKTDNTDIPTGGWINETSVKFTATVSDTDNPDTLYLCVEKDALGTSFSNTEDLCGSGVSYTGTPLTATVTITGITDATEYHWQARVKDTAGAYSSWISYDTNLESERDFGIDTTAPTGATIYDGDDGSQHDYNDYNTGSLTALSAYWMNTAPNFNVSGATTTNTYQYAIGTTQGGTDIKTWTYTGTSGTDKYVDATGLVLQTGVKYYFSVRAYDNAGNTATFYSSGQQVYPTLSFSVSANTVTFDSLNNANNWTNTKTTTITTSTNASSGYTVQAYTSDFLRSLAYGSIYIDAFAGTWATPQNWANFCKDDTNDCGFGYTSSDTSVQGSNRFASGANYASYSQASPGDVVADHTDAVNGTTGAVSNEQFTITHKVSVNSSQTASVYQTLLYIIVTANF